ncbi:MAG: hypothetical protein KGN36_12700 [Acidobacteriota bacterium]|nr:hypothetical protein [Acidobacteriota bacterium]
MLEFDLPVMSASTGLRDAFAPLIHNQVSGLVVEKGPARRLFHYVDLVNALANGILYLGDLPGGVALDEAPGGSPEHDYHLLHAFMGTARVLSRMERLANMYLSAPAGYCCDGPGRHCYPPYTRGTDDCCVVLLCPGHLP